MNGVSKRWTAWTTYREALTDLSWIENTELYMQLYAIIGRAVDDVLAQILPAVLPVYLRSDVIIASPSANYSTSGTGTWVAATRTLTFAGIAGPFGSGDINKVITFVVGGNGYTGTIASVPGTTSVIVAGPNVPAANGTVISLIVLGTRLSAETADISALSMSRVEGAPFVLESSSIDGICEVRTVEQLKDFRAEGLTNRSKIVYAIEGTSVLLRKGADVSTLGTLTAHYARLSYAPEADTDTIDLPDGPAAMLGVLRTEVIMARRLQRQVDLGSAILEQLRAAYAPAGINLSDQQLQAKADALK